MEDKHYAQDRVSQHQVPLDISDDEFCLLLDQSSGYGQSGYSQSYGQSDSSGGYGQQSSGGYGQQGLNLLT